MFLKNIDDARRLRKRVTLNFEAADLPGKSEEDRFLGVLGFLGLLGLLGFLGGVFRVLRVLRVLGSRP